MRKQQQQQQPVSQQSYRQQQQPGKSDDNIYSSTYNPYSSQPQQQGTTGYNKQGSYNMAQQYNQYQGGYSNGSATSYGSQYGSSNRCVFIPGDSSGRPDH